MVDELRAEVVAIVQQVQNTYFDDDSVEDAVKLLLNLIRRERGRAEAETEMRYATNGMVLD